MVSSASGSQLPLVQAWPSAAISEAPRHQTYLQSQMGMWTVWRRRRRRRKSPPQRTAGREGGFLHGAQGSELPAGRCLQTPLAQPQPLLCRNPCTPAGRDHKVRTVTVSPAHTVMWTTTSVLLLQGTARVTLLPRKASVTKDRLSDKPLFSPHRHQALQKGLLKTWPNRS